jgi:hypothetical protein
MTSQELRVWPYAYKTELYPSTSEAQEGGCAPVVA